MVTQISGNHLWGCRGVHRGTHICMREPQSCNSQVCPQNLFVMGFLGLSVFAVSWRGRRGGSLSVWYCSVLCEGSGSIWMHTLQEEGRWAEERQKIAGWSGGKSRWSWGGDSGCSPEPGLTTAWPANLCSRFICQQIDLLSCPLSSAASNLGCWLLPLYHTQSMPHVLIFPSSAPSAHWGHDTGTACEWGRVCESFLCICPYGIEMSFQGTQTESLLPATSTEGAQHFTYAFKHQLSKRQSVVPWQNMKWQRLLECFSWVTFAGVWSGAHGQTHWLPVVADPFSKSIQFKPGEFPRPPGLCWQSCTHGFRGWIWACASWHFSAPNCYDLLQMVCVSCHDPS